MSREISLVIDYDGITKTELRVKVQRLAPQMHPYPRFAGLPPKGNAIKLREKRAKYVF